MGSQWSRRDDKRLLDTIQTYMDTKHWVKGQRSLAWGAIADEMGRSIDACRNRYKKLRAEGLK